MKKMKLKHRIFLANLLVMLFAVVGFSLIANRMSRSYFIDETKNNLIREQQLVSQSLDTIFNSSQDYMRLTILDSGLQEAMLNFKDNPKHNMDSIQSVRVSREMAEILSNFIAPVTHIVGGAVVIDGEIVYSGYNIPIQNARNVITDDFLKEIAQKREPIWSEMTTLQFYNNQSVRTLMLGMSVIHKNSGRYLGECIFFVDESVFAGVYTSEEYPNGNLYLTDRTGKIISCDDKSFLDKCFSDVLGIDTTQYEVDLSNETAFCEAHNHDFCSISSYPRTDWLIVNTASYATAMAKNGTTVAMILITGVVCVLLFFLISSAISYTMIKPIKNIADDMARAGDGDLSVRATDTYNGEVQIIASAFNTLMDQMQLLLEEIDIQHEQSIENEFKILQAQINPHFLYNTIETIASLITLDMKKEAITTTMSLASFYRRSLSSGQSIITIREELQLAHDYISIQKLRYEDYFNYDFQISDVDQYCIPKLTLQPLIENAIYHGIKEREATDPGVIRITGRLVDNQVILEVYDNGAGIAPERLNRILSTNSGPRPTFGLSNVDQRIRYKYGNQYGLHIDSQVGKFTKVTVTLPAVSYAAGGYNETNSHS